MFSEHSCAVTVQVYVRSPPAAAVTQTRRVEKMSRVGLRTTLAYCAADGTVDQIEQQLIACTHRVSALMTLATDAFDSCSQHPLRVRVTDIRHSLDRVHSPVDKREFLIGTGQSA